MIEKDDVLLWFKASCGSSRVNVFCGMLKCCTALELRYFLTLLEGMLKEVEHPLKHAENEINKFIKPASDVTSSLDLSQVKDRSNCLALLAFLKSSDHRMASDLLYPALTTIDEEGVKDESVREELLLMLYMAANHPAFSFAERKDLWERIDTACKALSAGQGAIPVASLDPAAEEKSLETGTESTSPMVDNGWEDDTSSTNWADCDDVIPETIVVTGCQKCSGSGPFDAYRFDYSFEVTWSDGGFNRCSRSYTDLILFQNKLHNENEDAMQKVPRLSSKRSLNTYEQAKKLLPEISELVQKFLDLPRDVLSSQLVIDFFSAIGVGLDSLESSRSLSDLASSPTRASKPSIATSASGSVDSSTDITPRYSQDSLSPSSSTDAAKYQNVYITTTTSNSASQSNTNSLPSLKPGSSGIPSLLNGPHSPIAEVDENPQKDPHSKIPQKSPCFIRRIGGGVVYYEPHKVIASAPMAYLEKYAKMRSNILPSIKHSKMETTSDVTRPSTAGSKSTRQSLTMSFRDPPTLCPSPQSRTSSSRSTNSPHASIRSGAMSPPGLGSSCDEDTSFRCPSGNESSNRQRRKKTTPTSPAEAYILGSYGSAGDMKTFPSLQEWLKALRLHKYTTTLEDYDFDKLMSLTPEEVDALDMTSGARSKLTTHMDWMRKNGCSEFALSSKICDGGKKSRSQSRTSSFASLDRMDVGSGQPSRRSTSDFPSMQSSVSPTASTWSLPDALPGGSDLTRPRSAASGTSSRPSLYGAEAMRGHNTVSHHTSMPQLATSPRRKSETGLGGSTNSIPAHRDSGSKAQAMPRQSSVNSKTRRKAPASSTPARQSSRPGSSNSLSWRSSDSTDGVPPNSRRK
eukprot:scpid34133/ scgid4492/ 